MLSVPGAKRGARLVEMLVGWLTLRVTCGWVTRSGGSEGCLAGRRKVGDMPGSGRCGL